MRSSRAALLAAFCLCAAHAARAGDPAGRPPGELPRLEAAAAAELARVRRDAPRDSLALAAALTEVVLARDLASSWWLPDTPQLAEDAVAARERLLPPDHPDVATSLYALGRVRWRRTEFAAARPLLERALALRERAFGEPHPATAEALGALGTLMLDLEELERAGELLARAHAARLAALGPAHPATARGVAALGGWHEAEGRYPQADSLYRAALAAQEAALGPDHPDVAETLVSLAILGRQRGRDQEALAQVERALAIQERSFAPDCPDIGRTLDYAGSLHYALGNYGRARPLLERALAIRERTLGPDHPDVGTSLTNVARLRETTGDYRDARGMYERAIGIYERAVGPDHTIIAIILSSEGYLLRAMGDLPAARSCYERALAIREKAFGPDHPTVGSGLVNVGSVMQEEGDHRGARDRFERALAILEASLGPVHPHVAVALNSLGLGSEREGDYPGALARYRRARDIYREILGEGHPSTASVELNLAEVLRETGRPDSARVLLEGVLATRREVLGEDHPEVAKAWDRLALACIAGGDTSAAFDAALRAEAVGRSHLELTLPVLPEREALRFAAVRESGLDQALTLAASGLDSRFSRRAWDAVVRSRALVFDEMGLRLRTAFAHAGSAGDSAGGALGEYRAASEALARLMVQRVGNDAREETRATLAAAHRRRDEAERRLARTGAGEPGGPQTRRPAGLDEVAEALPPGSALAAFVAYQRVALPPDGRGPERAVPHVLAFLLAGPGAPVRCVDLGPAAALDAAVARWRDEAARGVFAGRSPEEAMRACEAAGTALREAAWDPIVALLGNADRVFVVPDGELNLVNLAALPDGDGGFLVESGPTLHALNAERDLVAPAAAPPGAGRTGEVLVLGGASFDEAAPALPASGPPGPDGGPLSALRSALLGCESFRELRFEPLPESGAEAAAVAALWRESAGGVTRLSGAEATEAAVKRLAPGCRALHLATHGFFLGSDCGAPSRESARGIGGLAPAPPGSAPPARAARQPLPLSGLALAGANRRLEAGPAEEDGVLTAEEILALDLRAVEWAVLSACDTGVGTIGAGEGVFGLKRAFQVAGARTVIMSLWGVQDEAARRWMERLYDARLRRGMDTGSAMRSAAREVLNERRAKGLTTHPFYWAGFVAAGDWR